MYWPNLKSVAFPVPEITGGTQNFFGSPRIRPRSLFSQIFNGRLFGWTLLRPTVLAKFEVRRFTVPEIIAIGVLGGVRTLILGKGRP